MYEDFWLVFFMLTASGAAGCAAWFLRQNDRAVQFSGAIFVVVALCSVLSFARRLMEIAACTTS